MKRYLLLIIIVLISSCDLFKTATGPDNPPRITTKKPTEYTLTKKIGDTVEFAITANDSDGDSIEYKTLQDGVQINETNTFEFIIDAIGGFRIQIIAYNTESDTAEWYVHVENQQPIISYMGHVNKNEDEIQIGEIVKSPTISDLEDSVSDLTVELIQTNTDLIKMVLDSSNQIIVESYQEGASGISEVQYKVTDTGGYSASKGFHYIINPMTDISGTILDSDTWLANTSLQGWVLIRNAQNQAVIADTLWTDSQGRYKTQIEPMTIIDIEAGYRSLDKTQPMSFITTARGVLASNDISDVDIMVVTYLNNNLTPEEFRIMAWETNFSMLDKNYTGAKVPSVDMIDYLVWENYTGDVFTQAEMNDVKKVIDDSIDVHLKHPFVQIEIAYFDPRTEEERTNVTKWIKHTTSNTAIGTLDFNSDGIVDYTYIKTGGAAPKESYYYELLYAAFISGLLEEGFGSRGEFGPVTHPTLEGKTIAYEHIGTEWVYPSDIKFIKFIEGVAHEVGYLKPKMPLDDVFKIQE